MDIHVRRDLRFQQVVGLLLEPIHPMVSHHVWRCLGDHGQSRDREDQDDCNVLLIRMTTIRSLFSNK